MPIIRGLSIKRMKPMKSRTLLLLLVLAFTPFLGGCAALVVGGAVTVASVADDRRTTGTVLDDQSFETRALFRVKNRFGERAHVSITSFNRHVLISGEADTPEIKAGIEAEVRATGPIRVLHNEMVVGPQASLASIANDTRLTGLVKSRMITELGLRPANHVKVVTESGVVYLLGLVSRAEGEAAARVAAATAGVARVVKLFEYLD